MKKKSTFQHKDQIQFLSLLIKALKTKFSSGFSGFLSPLSNMSEEKSPTLIYLPLVCVLLCDGLTLSLACVLLIQTPGSTAAEIKHLLKMND